MAQDIYKIRFEANSKGEWMQEYDQYSANSYDQGHKGVYSGEERFLTPLIKEAKGKILEAACGTGRILLHYLKNKFDIEGFDNSEAMLKILREKARKEGLDPTVYCQSMESLNLQNRYALIIIPLFSIQLIEKWENVLLSLQNFFNHLEEGGKFFLTLTFPNVVIDKRKQKQDFKKVQDTVKIDGGTAASGTRLFIASEQDLYNQIIKTHYRAEVWKQGRIIKKDQFSRILRWFSPKEMEMLLEKAGFSKIKMSGDAPDDKGPYQVGTFINFEAIKP